MTGLPLSKSVGVLLQTEGELQNQTKPPVPSKALKANNTDASESLWPCLVCWSTFTEVKQLREHQRIHKSDHSSVVGMGVFESKQLLKDYTDEKRS